MLTVHSHRFQLVVSRDYTWQRKAQTVHKTFRQRVSSVNVLMFESY